MRHLGNVKVEHEGGKEVMSKLCFQVRQILN